jgi:hypothetical protein
MVHDRSHLIRAAELACLAPIALGFLIGCADPMATNDEGANPTRPHDSRSFYVPAGQSTFTAMAGATAFYGTYDGLQGEASYQIEVPDTWNGVLVMYAHGYRGEVDYLTVQPPPAGLRAHLIDQGYAWAASSYSANYYDVRAGVEDTNVLALAFAGITGRSAPVKHYITGVSMGGHVTAAAVEQETLEQAASLISYAAAMPMCGVVADNELSNYFHAFEMAAHELAGITVTSFPVPDYDSNLVLIKQALWTDYAADRYGLTAQGEKFKNAFMWLSGGPRPTFEEDFPRYLDLLFYRAGSDGTWTGVLDGVSTNTTDVVYQLDANPAQSTEEVAFNAAVYRVEGNLEAHNPLRTDGVRALPIVEGRFSVPVLSVHTLEARVPFIHEQIYAQRAAAHGNASRLVQRAIRSSGHCDFTSEEWTAAFDALVDWEVDGIVPAGDDVLDPAVVAEPDFGCQFTAATRPGIPACP